LLQNVYRGQSLTIVSSAKAIKMQSESGGYRKLYVCCTVCDGAALASTNRVRMRPYVELLWPVVIVITYCIP